MKRPGAVPGRGPTKVPRAARLAEVVKQVVADLLAHGRLKDPRVTGAGLVTVTRVAVSGDGSVAKIGISVLGADAGAAARVVAGLESASGIIRKALGDALRARVTPEVRFHVDADVDAESRIERILAEDRARRDKGEE